MEWGSGSGKGVVDRHRVTTEAQKNVEEATREKENKRKERKKGKQSMRNTYPVKNKLLAVDEEKEGRRKKQKEGKKRIHTKKKER